ncbi:MAG: type VI secretion system protein TssA [Rhodothermales bacterium]
MAEAPSTETAEATGPTEGSSADLLAVYADVIAEAKKPISDATPCGEDVKYDEEFLELKTEVDDYGSGAADVDYDKIVELGRSILRHKAKDLTTAGFLVMGLMRTKEVKGVAEGVVILDAIVETFWEQVHPQKPVRRRNAIQFVADQVTSWLQYRLETQKPTLDELAPLELTRDTLKEMQGFLMQELQDKAPALSGILRALEDTIRRVPKPKPSEPKATPTATPPSGEGTAVSAEAPRAVPSELSSPTEATRLISKAVSFLREQDGKHPMPYRLLRALRWGRLVQEPPNENGTTKIPAPPAQRLAYFSGLLEKGEYGKLIDEGERDFQGTSIFWWLDLQRLIVAGMEALGAPFKEAAEAVMMETALLVRRLPGLVDLAYADETPFADPMTLEWLETKVGGLLGEGGGGGAPMPSRAGGSDHLDAQFKEARQMLGKGDLSGALARMQEGQGDDVSEEDRFRRRLYQAVMCLRGKKPEVARAMLESLDEEATRYALDTWNPALMLDVWSNLYACYTTLVKKAKSAEKASMAERATRILDNISRVDPAYALTVLGKK